MARTAGGGLLGWSVMALLALGVAGYSVANALLPELRNGFVAGLVARAPWAAILHMGGGAIALVLGTLQFHRGLRTRRPALHRRLGQGYVLAVLASGLAGLYLATQSQSGLAARFGFGLLALAWLWSTARAYTLARARRFDAHQAWMLRSYALCLAAVTLRLYIPAFLVAGVPFPAAYPAIAWLCWVPNLVLAEWWVLRGEGRTVARAGG